ncbi:MAG: hypothetical protein ACXWEW_06660, partial [Nitrososphaeraceae archaeon]
MQKKFKINIDLINTMPEEIKKSLSGIISNKITRVRDISVNDYAVEVINVTKRYRIHYEKNPSLKETII